MYCLREIAPLFFTAVISARITYYQEKRDDVEGLGTWQGPPVYANVVREFVGKDCNGCLLAFGANL